MNATTLHRQWAKRPDDQRFLSLQDLLTFTRSRKERSLQVESVPIRSLRVMADDSDDSLRLLLPDESDGGQLTNWMTTQLCGQSGTRGDSLRRYSPSLAARMLNEDLSRERTMDGEPIDLGNGKLLLLNNPSGGRIARALTGPKYGRIFDADVVAAVIQNAGPTWKVPGASYAHKNPKLATTLYASDRDVFICLVDESRPIDVNGEKLFRGVIVSNSETGKAALNVSSFLYAWICDNRTIWGLTGIEELKVRHTSGGPARWMAEAKPTIDKLLTASDAPVRAAILLAQQTTVTNLLPAPKKGESLDDTLASWLRKEADITQTIAVHAVKAAREVYGDRAGGPHSVWNLAAGITDAAHAIPHTDRRIVVEAAAGDLLAKYARYGVGGSSTLALAAPSAE